MIKTSVAIPDVWDIKDFDSLRTLLVDLKLVIEELASKAQPMQIELRTTIPTVNDLEEGEMVRHTNNNIYTKLNGVIRTIATS